MFFRKWLSDEAVERRYVDAGSIFGAAVSYLYMGECSGFKRLLSKWEKWENEYVRRGFRTLSIDAFIDRGGYGVALEGLGEKRNELEEPVFHARIYRERYLGKVTPVFNPWNLMEKDGPKVATGNYVLPSTEDAR